MGFFPFQRRGGDEGLPVGFGISSVHGAVTDPGAPPFDPRELIGACGLDSWYFDHLVPSSPFEPHYSQLRNACFVDVAHGYDTYARERREAGSGQIADLERQARRRTIGDRYSPASADCRGGDRTTGIFALLVPAIPRREPFSGTISASRPRSGIDSEWIETNILTHPAEVVGAAWDGRIGSVRGGGTHSPHDGGGQTGKPG